MQCFLIIIIKDNNHLFIHYALASKDCPIFNFDKDNNITSPHYPNYYRGLLYCNYNIVVTASETIAIQFESFNVGKKIYSYYFPCNRSYISIAKDMDAPIQLCGDKLPAPVYLSGGNFTMVFKSYHVDGSFRFNGRIQRLPRKLSLVYVHNNLAIDL